METAVSDHIAHDPIADAAVIEQSAADWLQRRRYWKNWSDSEQEALDDWLSQSMTHRVAYWRLEAVMDRAERLSVLHPQKMQRPFAAPQKTSSWKMLRIVAAALVVATGVGLWALNMPSGEPRGQTYATSLGGRTVIKLTDGSSIELNTNTVVHADVRAGRRYVSIQRGEAYFDIVHDAKHPFVVDAAGHRITDLGTKFVVRKDARRVELTLVEGRASIASDQPGVQGHSAVLMPGDVAIATADSISIEQKTKPDVTRELSWRHGLLIFDGATLESVAEELNRYSKEKLVISGSDAKRLTIDASVPTSDVRAFTRVAKDVFGLRVRDTGHEIVISR